jgi:DNA-binding MarR family transcriptional regulator
MEAHEASPDSTPTDSVDRHVEEWRQVIDDLDPLTEGIVSRMQKLVFLVKNARIRGLEGLGLASGEWELLHSLRRQGPPWRAASSALAADLLLSASALTNRVDQLEKRGLVRRVADPDDRRRVLVEPTDEGIALYERTMAEQGRFEQQLVELLPPERRGELNDLLRQLLAAAERS